jgi:hypothetical protein
MTKHMYYKPPLMRRLVAVDYSTVPDRQSWPRGIYIFTDFERMTQAQREMAAKLWSKLEEQGDKVVLYNHPTRYLERVTLLQKLHEMGINDFNVHRLTDYNGAVRFPAFLRYGNRHNGALTQPAATQAELEDQIALVLLDGHEPQNLIISEFIDVQDTDGIYKKYGVFRIGPHSAPRHMFVGTHWEGKQKWNTLRAEFRAEETAFLKDNPHSEEVFRLFELANLQYGRIDYAFKNGRIQVWEINDNPQINSSLWRYRKAGWRRAHVSLSAIWAGFSAELERIKPGPDFQLDLSGIDVRSLISEKSDRVH